MVPVLLLERLMAVKKSPKPDSPIKNVREAKKARKTVAGRPAEPGRANGVAVSPDAIARRAYALFLGQGAQHGHDLEHRLAAERELLAHNTVN